MSIKKKLKKKIKNMKNTKNLEDLILLFYMQLDLYYNELKENKKEKYHKYSYDYSKFKLEYKSENPISDLKDKGNDIFIQRCEKLYEILSVLVETFNKFENQYDFQLDFRNTFKDMSLKVVLLTKEYLTFDQKLNKK